MTKRGAAVVLWTCVAGTSWANAPHGPHPVIAHPVAVASHVIFDNDTQPEVDLRPKIEALGLKIRNQGNRGTCSVFATAFLLELAYARSASTGTANPPMFDGHSIDLVGFRDSTLFPGGGYFVYRNSFGPEFGDKGYGFVSYQYVLDYGNDGIVAGTALQPVPKVVIPHLPPQPPGEHTAR